MVSDKCYSIYWLLINYTKCVIAFLNKHAYKQDFEFSTFRKSDEVMDSGVLSRSDYSYFLLAFEAMFSLFAWVAIDTGFYSSAYFYFIQSVLELSSDI